MNYRVRWEIDVDAENTLEAARQARAAQLRPYTLATVFDVYNSDDAGKFVRVDLTQLDAEETAARYAQRREWINEIVKPDSPVRNDAQWDPPQQPERYLLIERDLGAVISASLYPTPAAAAHAINEMWPVPDEMELVDLDERKAYQPMRRTIAFYQPGQSLDSLITV